MKKKDYGVDLSSNNDPSAQKYASVGSKFAIVKVTEGTNYKNPDAQSQMATAIASGQEVHAYFFAVFSNNSYLAQLNAEYAINTAKELALPKGSILATDWETGDGNRVDGDVLSNTQAILTSMRLIKQAGYKPMLYTGAYVAENNINLSLILKEFPNSLWIASYATMERIDDPDFGYFPSIDGIAIWQFTRNWLGLKVDGNIALLDIDRKGEDDEMNWHPQVKFNELGRFKVTREGGADLYSDSTLTKIVGHRDFNQNFAITRAVGGAVCAGTNQWFSQADGITKINPLAINDKAPALAIVTDQDVWTQNEAKPSNGITHLKVGSKWKVTGRSDKYLVIGNANTGKYIDGNKVEIIL